MAKNESIVEVLIGGEIVKIEVDDDFLAAISMAKALLEGDYQVRPIDYQLNKAFVVFGGDIDAMMAGVLNWAIWDATVLNGKGLKIKGTPQEILQKAKGFVELLHKKKEVQIYCIEMLNRHSVTSIEHALSRINRSKGVYNSLINA